MASSVLASGCGLSPAFTLPAPEQQLRLAVVVEADSTNVEAASELAVARLIDGDVQGARTLLESTAALVPSDPAILALLALANEAAGRVTDAAGLFDMYAREQVGSLAALAAARLEAIRPDAYREEARRVLTGGPGPVPDLDSGRALVIPFTYSSGDPDVAAASAALAILVGVDFERRNLRTVDPQRVRIFLEQMGVGPDRFADMPLGVELGRSFGADVVIQGAAINAGTDSAALNLTVMRLEAGVLDSVTQVALSGDFGRLGEAGRRISTFVMGLLDGRPQLTDSYGPVLTAHASAAVLAGRSAQALDRSDAASARVFAEEALAIDPTFSIASDLLERAELVSRAEAMPFDTTLLEAARLGALLRSVMTLRADPQSAHQSALSRVGRRDRVLASDLLGLDRVEAGVFLEITFGVDP